MELRKIALKPSIFILCNGQLAEPLYFQDLKDYLRAHNVTIQFKKEYRGAAPWHFIAAAAKLKEKLAKEDKFVSIDGDQFWCVFDVDDYWDNNEKCFRDALNLAKTNGIRIAWSNECFEFWFLCHFVFLNSAIPRGDYHKKLGKYFRTNGLRTYKKNMKNIFELLLPFQKTAIKHANKLYVKDGVHKNPSTAVAMLVKELLNYFG